MLDVLLRFHGCECVVEAFVLYDSGVAYALVFVEDAIGKQVTFPSHLERPICEVVNLDVLACQLVCQFTTLQDDLPSVVRKGKLLAEVTLLAMAEDVGQTGYLHVQPAMQVFGLRWRKYELLVEALHEFRQEGIASIHVGDVCQAQLLY
jgi:hypothetical protein